MHHRPRRVTYRRRRTGKKHSAHKRRTQRRTRGGSCGSCMGTPPLPMPATA